ncbi:MULTISPECIES: helix-turn-helix transcriptional regulator [unclassified Pyramidobacter]|uniref:helix-turn-helix transcriptional regulator n=1 Tax=unclassified Pyramidobacter TaxID=2632171 RepID=UPI000EA340E8|nr:helix-turn-helix transcriptional regulator [Pyramidobacter sp. CG50-2]RKJ80541.1 XRE family transcriptional regulator [Pyramidobacter sp. CG50-2]
MSGVTASRKIRAALLLKGHSLCSWAQAQGLNYRVVKVALSRYDGRSRRPSPGTKTLTIIEMLERETGVTICTEKAAPDCPRDEFQRRLLAVRAEAGLTAAQMAALLGMTPRAYCLYENGVKKVPLSLAVALARRGIDGTWFLLGEGAMGRLKMTGEGPVHLDKRDDAKGAQ